MIDGNTIEVCCVLGDRKKVHYIGTDTPPSILQKGSYTPSPPSLENYGTRAQEATLSSSSQEASQAERRQELFNSRQAR